MKARDTTNDDMARALVVSLAASAVIASTYLSAMSPLPHVTAEILIVALPAVGAVLSGVKLGRRRPARFATLVVTFYALLLVGADLVRTEPDGSIITVLSAAALPLILTFIGGLLTHRELAALARVLVFIGAAQALLAIAEVQNPQLWAVRAATVTSQGGYMTSPNLILDGYTRANGTMGHPILVGMTCCIAAFIVAVHGRKTRLLWRLPLLGLLMWGALLSGSRSPLAALCFAGIVYLLHRRTTIATGWRWLAFLALIPLTYMYISSTLEAARQLSPFSVSNRAAAGDRLVDTFNRPGMTSLIGEGPTFALETVVDNQFVTTSGRYGIIGLMILLAVVTLVLTARSATIAALGALVIFMFLSFDVFAFSSMAALFWVLVGAARSPQTLSEPPQELAVEPAQVPSTATTL